VSSRFPNADVPHGTTGGYTNHDCRCDACRAAWREYKRKPDVRERQREAQRRWYLKRKAEREGAEPGGVRPEG
jgi:hypothetical protein